MELPARGAVASSALPPDGDYVIEVIDAKRWVKETTGSESLFIQGRIVDGDFAGCHEPRVWVSPAMKDGTTLRQIVDVLLPDTPDGPLNLTKDMIDRMVGKRALVEIIQDPYQGEIKAKIQPWSFRPVDIPVSDVPADTSGFKEPEPAAVGNGKVDEDIPF